MHRNCILSERRHAKYNSLNLILCEFATCIEDTGEEETRLMGRVTRSLRASAICGKAAAEPFCSEGRWNDSMVGRRIDSFSKQGRKIF